MPRKLGKPGKPGKPLHSVYIGNSVTTYSALNPGFAIYHYDRDLISKGPGYNIAHDYEEYWLNLTDANARNATDGWLKPAWKATEEYGIPDVRLKTDELV